MRGRPLDAGLAERICKLLTIEDEDVSVPVIAVRCGVSRSLVNQINKKHDIRRYVAPSKTRFVINAKA